MVISGEDYPNDDDQDDEADQEDDQEDDEADQGKEQKEAGAREGGDAGQVLEPQASLGVSVIQTRPYIVENGTMRK